MRYLLKIKYVAFFCRNRINGKSIHGIKEGLKEGDWAITSWTLGSTRGGGEGTGWPPFGPDRSPRRRVEGRPAGEPKAGRCVCVCVCVCVHLARLEEGIPHGGGDGEAP